MKNNLWLAFLLGIFISCKSNTKQPVLKSTETTPLMDNSKLLIAEFKPIIQGVWVKSAYIDKVIQTKSPLAAAGEDNGMTTMIINTDQIAGDSISVGAGWNNHDGSNLILRFKAGSQKATIQFGTGDLGYSVKGRDTILTTYWPGEKDKSKMIATHYKRAFKKNTEELGLGLDYMINKGIIAGNYILTDDSGNKSKVNFNADGSVNGILNFKKYGINIDLNSDVMDNLDEIGFDFNRKGHKSYSFKINADTLMLYETKPNTDSTLLILDELKYKLVKQK
ncbi:hypothetical protein SNE25_07590 [Mucilaginibacter sabulilitoris]|uniref:Uncharacterized protein n=1 Tax=Mucilaginibacter sabulilitoris TaxID=1173583 RepID=A0ABZ0TQG4_9SPHI|nr:hypothetical protein [Mucilaginibacter sabulilitoris]WPU95384.1 hypothetical protein SNE25_07590 [Mucilaginibacter sabulilitoris]